MGNGIGIGKTKRTKVMKIDGQTDKYKTPIRAYDIIKNYPGHVLFESSSVKRHGIRAKPLEPQQDLESNKIYFLTELPKIPEDQRHRALKRTKSAAVRNHTSAQERLECLMLSRGRSLCDRVERDGPVRVKMRIPRAHVVKLVEESRDGVEVAEKIIDIYMEHNTSGGDRGSNGVGGGGGGGGERRVSAEVSSGLWLDYGKGARRPNFRSAITE